VGGRWERNAASVFAGSRVLRCVSAVVGCRQRRGTIEHFLRRERGLVVLRAECYDAIQRPGVGVESVVAGPNREFYSYRSSCTGADEAWCGEQAASSATSPHARRGRRIRSGRYCVSADCWEEDVVRPCDHGAKEDGRRLRLLSPSGFVGASSSPLRRCHMHTSLRSVIYIFFS
jgi:hypothetical protein